MTSTFILFRSPSLLYQTANFLNGRLFKMKYRCNFVTLQATSVKAGCHTSGYSVDQWATRKHYWFQEKRGCSWCSVATGHVFVSTESTIEYIIDACTIGLIVKVSSFWLMYGWTIYIYNNILKKKKLRELMTLSVSLYRPISLSGLWIMRSWLMRFAFLHAVLFFLFCFS